MATLCGAALAACDSIKDVRDAPTTPVPTPMVVLKGTISGVGRIRPVVLQNNGTELSFRGTEVFSFDAVPVGSNYDITVKTQPYGKHCDVINGSGTASAQISNIAVVCVSDPAIPRYSLGGTISTAAAAVPDGKVILTTEEGSVEQPMTGMSSFVFNDRLFDSGTSVPIFEYTTTATFEQDGTVNNCAVANGRNVNSSGEPVSPTGNVTNVAVGACAFTVGGTVGYNVPTGGSVQPINGLALALKDQAGDTLQEVSIPAFTPATNTSTTAFTFQQQMLSHGRAVYHLAVKTQPAGLHCIVDNGGLVSLVSPANITNLAVRCRAVPAVQNRLTGTYRRYTVDGDGNEVYSRSFLAFFDNGTFIHGVHGNSTAVSGVEHGFYNYNSATGTMVFTVRTDTNGSTVGLSGTTGFASQNASATGVQKSGTSPGRMSLTFGTATWLLEEPKSIEGQMTGAWVSADSLRMWVFDFQSTYGFHAGVNGGANLTDACFVLDDGAAPTGYYTRRGGSTGCTPGGTGFTTIDLLPSPAPPGFGGRFPGTQNAADGRPPSPINFVVTPGEPDVLTVQETLNGDPVNTPVVMYRSRAN